jgi:Protein of unknown function (DUF559)
MLRTVDGETGLTHLLCGLTRFRRLGGDDETIAALATRQHGVVARRQLLELGIGRRSIEHRLARGRLRRLWPGRRAAYAVGHEALTQAGRATAGVIVAGPGAVVSHWTAAALHGIDDRRRAVVHVTAPKERRSRRGLFIHHARLPAEEVVVLDGIPVTSVARLALDLSAERDQRMLRTLIKRAEFKGLVTASEIVDVLQRYPRRRGRGTLARIAASYALTAGRTQSPLEDDFLEFCGVRDVPLPETNVPIAAGGRTYVVDCVWREARVIVELDGRDAHARELAFEDDRARDRALIAAGWRPIRVTSAQLRRGADALEHDVRAVLGLRR